MTRHHGQVPFTIFEITPLGLIYAAIGIAYVLLVGRKLLPRRETLAALHRQRDGARNFSCRR